jgi:hypothetical protein
MTPDEDGLIPVPHLVPRGRWTMTLNLDCGHVATVFLSSNRVPEMARCTTTHWGGAMYHVGCVVSVVHVQRPDWTVL